MKKTKTKRRNRKPSKLAQLETDNDYLRDQLGLAQRCLDNANARYTGTIEAMSRKTS